MKTHDKDIDVLVVGGANTDYLIRGPQLPEPGSTIEGEEFQQAPGGKGANQAVAAARLGARVAFVGKVGDDERGTELLATLRHEGVDVSGVSRDPEADTGRALVMVDWSGQKQIMTAPGANQRLTAADVALAGELFARAHVLLVQLESPQPALDMAIHLARTEGARVILDPAPPRLLPEGFLSQLDVIRPNAAEAEYFTGQEVIDERTCRAAARVLLRKGAHAAVVAAPGGTVVASHEGERWLPNLGVDMVDSTGAGDAFAGALAVSLAQGKDLGSAALVANVAAALKLKRLGAQAGLPTRAEVDHILAIS